MTSTHNDMRLAKRAAGYHAADMVTDGMVVGLGTGSTINFTLERLQTRVREGLEILGIPTSYQTASRAREYGIPLTTLDDHPSVDLAIDGADQIDPELQVIKGRGAAHLREKCLVSAAREFIIVADRSKLVDHLHGCIPLEILPFACGSLLHHLKSLGGTALIRQGIMKDGPVITDNGNFVLDCTFDEITVPRDLESTLNSLDGILGSGLFCRFTEKTTLIVADEKETQVRGLRASDSLRSGSKPRDLRGS